MSFVYKTLTLEERLLEVPTVIPLDLIANDDGAEIGRGALRFAEDVY